MATVAWICIASLALLAGCSTYERAADGTDKAFRLGAWDREYRLAMRSYEDGDYALAAAGFESLLYQLPESDRRELVMYRLAESYLFERDFHNAEQTFAAYQDRYPQGQYVADAGQNRVRIIIARNEPTRAALELLEQAERELTKLIELEKQYPTDPRIKYLLGNLYYQKEDYETAGQKYFEAQSYEAALSEPELIRDRLYIDETGQPRVLTPSEMEKLDRERNPLVIFDVSNYYERRNSANWSAASQQVYRNVTGKIRNQGSRTLRNVEIEVRFVNAINEILDVEVVHVGYLEAGSVRAFIARARHYDNIYNITRVETYPRYQ